MTRSRGRVADTEVFRMQVCVGSDARSWADNRCMLSDVLQKEIVRIAF